jgi:small GTP-binding protein
MISSLNLSQEDLPKFKIVFLGDVQVGKTSIALRKLNGNFSQQTKPTVGSSNYVITVEIDRKKIQLIIWDRARQEKFSSLIPQFLRGTDVTIIVASIDNHQSIENIDLWYNKVIEANEKVPAIIAINKIDLNERDHALTDDQIQNKFEGKFHQIHFVSALTGDHVDELFADIAKICLNLTKKGRNQNPLEPQNNFCCRK